MPVVSSTEVNTTEVDPTVTTPATQAGVGKGQKRPRKPRALKSPAVGEDSTPKAVRKPRTKKPAIRDDAVTDLAGQTPMPASETPDAFGPPPAEWTPATQSKLSLPPDF